MEFKWDDKPSRELDAKVHMKLGFKEEFETYDIDYMRTGDGDEIMVRDGVSEDVPHYSSDIDAAMPIADKYGFSIDPVETGWFCGIIGGPNEAAVSGLVREGWVIAPTIELAICGAFLNTWNLKESKGIRLVSALIKRI